MSRPRNSSKPISELGDDDKLIASILGTGLANRGELLETVKLCQISNEFFEDDPDGVWPIVQTTNRDIKNDAERSFGALCIHALRNGDSSFFTDLSKIISHTQSGNQAMPVDQYILVVHSIAPQYPNGIPKGGFSALELFEKVKKKGIHCADIKTIRQACKRLGIKLRRESPGRKKQGKK